MHHSNVCQALVLTLAFLLLGGKIEAATLRGDFFFGDEPGNLTVHVAQGRITAVGITLPRAVSPGSGGWDFFGTPTTYNGTPGREFWKFISSKNISNVVVRYTNITRSRAREFQSEEWTYVNSGTQTIFYPDGGGAAIVTKQDLTPYSHSGFWSAHAHVTVMRTSSLRGHILKLVLNKHSLGFTVSEVHLVFEQAKGGTWNVKIKVSRTVLYDDVFEDKSFASTARLHGRAEIDPEAFVK